MIVESQNQQPSVNVYPNGNGGNYGGGFGDMFGGMGGGGAIFFWLILFFFMMMFMGWGNNGNAAGNNAGSTVYVPYGMGMGGMGGMGAPAYSIQQNFDQAALVNGINGLQTQMQTGFSNAEVSRCNQQANILQQMNNNQNAVTTQLQNLNMGLQNCCCENRAATADLKYTVATEACSDRAAVGDAFQGITAQNNANMNTMMVAMNNGFQSIKDQMCNDKIDQKNERIADLERQLTMANLAASQNAQTSAIQAGQRTLANEIEQFVNPTPIPAWIVQNPSCCNQNYNTCGCRG